MICATQAIVLNYKKFSDTSVICNLYSQDYGKLSIIAKGARTLKNIHSAILQPLNHIDLIYYYKSKRNIQLLKEASIISTYYNIPNNYNKMLYTFIISDIINFSSYNNSPCNIIFRLTNKTLELIDGCEDDFLVYYYMFFMIQLLIYLGYHPILNKCNECNNEIGEGVFDDRSGQLLCSKCTKKKLIISKEAFTFMQQLSKTHISKICNQSVSRKKILPVIKEYLFKFALYHVPDLRKSKAFVTFNT